MAEYAMSFDEVLKMPLKRFWFLSDMIVRLRAERDLRQVQLLAAAGSQKGFDQALESLETQKGLIYVWEETPGLIVLNTIDDNELDPEFDRAGLHALKGKMSA